MYHYKQYGHRPYGNGPSRRSPGMSTSSARRGRQASHMNLQVPRIQLQPVAAMPSLAEHLEAAKQSYVAGNAVSKSHFDAKSQYLPCGNTRSVLHHDPFPLTFVSGSGAKLVSADGDEYTDFLGEYTAGLFGHSNPYIKDAVKAALDKGLSLGGGNQYEGILAEKLCTRFGLSKVRFTNSGTEANMIAIAAAKAATGRSKVLVFTGGYHGSTLSFPANGKDSKGNPLNIPHDYILIPYNELWQFETRKISEAMWQIAAILVEPMQGAAGCIPATTEFLIALRQLATVAGAVLIFDEIQTSRLAPQGLGRVYGISPDVITAGKYLGGGLSFSCFGAVADSPLGAKTLGVFESAGGIAHAGTFNNNTLSMAAAIAACDVLTDERLVALNTLGDKLRAGIDALLEKHLGPQRKMGIRGVGSLMNFWFADEDARALWWFWAAKERIYFAFRGFVALNLEHTQADVRRFLMVLARFLEAYGPLLKD